MSEGITVSREAMAATRRALTDLHRSSDEMRLTVAERDRIDGDIDSIVDALKMDSCANCANCEAFLVPGDMVLEDGEVGTVCADCAPTVADELSAIEGVADDEPVNECGKTAGEIRKILRGMNPAAKRYLEPLVVT